MAGPYLTLPAGNWVARLADGSVRELHSWLLGSTGELKGIVLDGYPVMLYDIETFRDFIGYEHADEAFEASGPVRYVPRTKEKVAEYLLQKMSTSGNNITG